MSCQLYVSTCLPISIILEEIVPEEAAGVGDHGVHHVLDDKDHHDVHSDPFVVVEESQVFTCVSFLFQQCMLFFSAFKLSFSLKARFISKGNFKNMILLRPAMVWTLNCTECWSASWWASLPSPSSGGGPAGNVLDEVFYHF